MFPSSRLGPRKDLRNNRDPFLERDNIRDTFKNDSTPLGRRTRFGGMGTQSDLGDFPNRSTSSEDFWNFPRPSQRYQNMEDDMENFMRQRREGSPFANKGSTPTSSTSSFDSAQPSNSSFNQPNSGPSFRQGGMPRASTPDSTSPRHFTSRYNFNFDNRNAQSDTDGHQPVIHHIPIRIEPRDESETSTESQPEPVNNSQGNLNREVGSTSQSFQERPHQKIPTQKQDSPEARTAKSAREKSPVPVSSSPIPLPEPPPHPSSPIPLPEPQRHASPPIPLPKPLSKATPKENTETNCVDSDSQNELKRPHSRSSTNDQKPKALKIIEEVRKATHDLKDNVKQFRGVKNDKDYLYLDEMLTRNLIRLDNIIVDGNEEIRSLRKAAVLELSLLTQQLEIASQRNMENSERSLVCLQKSQIEPEENMQVEENKDEKSEGERDCSTKESSDSKSNNEGDNYKVDSTEL